jgi:DNA mismatch repair protein MutH
MERAEAIDRLKKLQGCDLHELAKPLGVTVRTLAGTVNKGWAGHVCERFLGLPLNSSQSPNFGSWELKVVPIKRLADGSRRYKETMAITMIDPVHVVANSFEQSHLLTKLLKFVWVVREVGTTVDQPSLVVRVAAVDLTSGLRTVVENDYETVRKCLMDPARGFAALTGSMGTYIQPRTKGPGHGSVSRAFYGRKQFLQLVAPV